MMTLLELMVRANKLLVELRKGMQYRTGTEEELLVAVHMFQAITAEQAPAPTGEPSKEKPSTALDASVIMERDIVKAQLREARALLKKRGLMIEELNGYVHKLLKLIEKPYEDSRNSVFLKAGFHTRWTETALTPEEGKAAAEEEKSKEAT